jgi:hypothetical protein
VETFAEIESRKQQSAGAVVDGVCFASNNGRYVVWCQMFTNDQKWTLRITANLMISGEVLS